LFCKDNYHENFINLFCSVSPDIASDAIFLHPPKASEGSVVPLMDLVCNMKIADKSEAYEYKYKDKTYYFDSNTCKETFKMNPEKFINNACNTAK